jgi:LysM repeat protein
MIPKRQGVGALLAGILVALISSVIVLGGFALAFQENHPGIALDTSQTATVTQVHQATITYTTIPLKSPSITITLLLRSPTSTITPIPSNTVTISPSLTSCPPTDVPVISPTVTVTPILCGPPPGWVYYTVQAGDTLFRLSQIFGVSVWQLQFANCLGSSTTIQVGQLLFVPYWYPIHTPIFIGTLTATPTMIETPFPTIPIIPTSTEIIQPSITSTFSYTYTPAPTNPPTETTVPPDLPTLPPAPSETPVPAEEQ